MSTIFEDRFKEAGFDRLRFELKVVALQFSRDDWIAIHDEATKETAEKGQIRHVQQDQTSHANPRHPMGGKDHASDASDGQALNVPPSQPNPGEGQGPAADNGQPSVADARTPLPSGDQTDHVQQDQDVRVPAGQPVASRTGQSLSGQQALGTRARPAREPKRPNKARSFVEVRATRIEVESLFEYKLFGRCIRDHARKDLIAAHAKAARELKTSLLVAAKDVYDYALVDQMLKHSSGTAADTPATKMFRPIDLKRFDERAKAMIAEQAAAVAEIGSTYLMQKTVEISNALA